MPTRLPLFVRSVVIALAIGTTSQAAASPQDLFGYGPRSQGMAMTGASYSTGYEATFANPAGLADTGRYGLTLGFSANDFQLQVDGRASQLPTSRGLVIGLALPLPFGGPLRNVLTFGAGFFTPTNAVMEVKSPYPERIQWPVLSRSQVVAIQLGASVNLDRWVPGLRLGVGVSGSANMVGVVSVGLDAANQFLSRTETQLTSHFSPIAGVRYQRDRFAIGVTYRAELASRIAMDIEVHDLPIALPLLTIHALAQYDPHQIVVEGSYLPTDSLRLVVGLTYRRWSRYAGPLTKSSEGSNVPPAPNFHDTVTPRVAVEWTTRAGRTDVAVRGGYAFEPTPAPVASARPGRDPYGVTIDDGSTVEVRYLDSHRHVLTTGFGLRIPVDEADPESLRFDVDFAGSLQVVTSREHALPRFGATEPMVSRGLIPGASATVGVAW